MARAAVKSTEIPEAKIRQAIWMIKSKKTKKSICEHLGIAYNTKRLDSIIQEFHDRLAREADLKKKARTKVFTDKEKRVIADEYLNGETQSGIAKTYFVSPARIKKILIDMNTPIRGRGKKSAATVDHVVQDLEMRFNKGDKVFLAEQNCFAIVEDVFDEEWLDHHDNGRQKYVETYKFKPGRNGMAGLYAEPTKGIHYELYWLLEGEVLPQWKLNAFLHKRNQVSKIIEETGRESYRIYKEGDYGGYVNAFRHELFPVKAA